MDRTFDSSQKRFRGFFLEGVTFVGSEFGTAALLFGDPNGCQLEPDYGLVEGSQSTEASRVAQRPDRSIERHNQRDSPFLDIPFRCWNQDRGSQNERGNVAPMKYILLARLRAYARATIARRTESMTF